MAVQTFTVAANADDVQTRQSGSSIIGWNEPWVSGGFIGIGSVGTLSLGGWFRFTNVAVAQGTTLTSAILKLSNDSAGHNGDGPLNLTIYCEAADNPSIPSDAADATVRPLTSGTTLVVPFTDGTYELDITPEVQAVFNRVGWALNNAFSVVVKNNTTGTNYTRVRPYEQSPTFTPPQIEITTEDPEGVINYTPIVLNCIYGGAL